MRERMRYYVDKGRHYKFKETLTWRFYFRVIKKWFIPCDKCQTKFDEMWNAGIYIDGDFYRKFIETCAMKICSECANKIREEVSKSEVILGNKDYEPHVELSRKWIDGKLVEITEEEYYQATKTQTQ